MSITFALILALITQEECPATLTLQDPIHDTHAAKEYAACMSRPHLPAAREYVVFKQRCSTLAQRAPGSIVEWVDHLARNLPGCETQINFESRAT